MAGISATAPVVVGVDGSPGSQLALEWATEEARLRRTALVAVNAWEFPPESPYFIIPVNGQELADAAAQTLATAVKALRNARPGLRITIEQRVREGNAVRILTEEARAAQLLVVGSRGLGGFSGLVLGSVSAQLAHHMPCPLLIVPTPAPAKRGGSQRAGSRPKQARAAGARRPGHR